MENKNPVGYDGVCPVCGSVDGMIIFGNDGKYRTMCRVMGCAAWYKPCPQIGFDTKEDCQNPFDSEYLKDGTVSVAEYVLGNMKLHHVGRLETQGLCVGYLRQKRMTGICL